jgi:hypothetical protein
MEYDVLARVPVIWRGVTTEILAGSVLQITTRRLKAIKRK